MPQRYFIDQESFDKKIITDEDAHHIIKVMRMKQGDEIIICFKGHCYLSEIIEISDHVKYQFLEELNQDETLDITLIQGLPKGNKIDIVTKYATIYGVKHIMFLEMKRSISKEKNSDNKLKRLATIAKEAAELAHRFDIPKIEFKKRINDIDFDQFDIILVADENEKTQTLNHVMNKRDLSKSIAFIIGPEGGITEEERSFFKSKQAQFISLGKNILPTEIASLYVLTYFSLKKCE